MVFVGQGVLRGCKAWSRRRSICLHPSGLRAWEPRGPLASLRLVGSGLGRQQAQHCLLFGLGISGRPGQRLGLPNRGLTVSTHLPPPPNQFPVLWNGVASACPSTGLQQGGSLGDKMTKNSEAQGALKSHPAPGAVSVACSMFPAV